MDLPLEKKLKCQKPKEDLYLENTKKLNKIKYKKFV